MVLANYVSAFENGVIKAANSPLLAKYPAMLIDYSSVTGCGRITVKSIPATGDTAETLFSAVLLLLSSMTLAILCTKRKKKVL